MQIIKAKTKKGTKNAVRKPVKRIPRKDIEADFDRIRKTLDEIALIQRETEEEMRSLRLVHKETEKTLNKAIGGLSNTVGSLIEHVMTPDLLRKFRQFGFTFDYVTTIKWADGEGNIYTEIDGFLENGEQAMVVEVKTTLRRNDVDDHLQRMERVRIYADNHGDRRKFLGAMAAAIIDRDTKTYALSKGFFVIEPSGEDVKVTKPDSEPKMW
ncbi:MAG: hypothetical protein LBR47_01715 [Spirochaetaceae bacterium]|jgi:hypothetical protein|nr:hypothetical protein [Spirochaetaceae bacterium]